MDRDAVTRDGSEAMYLPAMPTVPGVLGLGGFRAGVVCRRRRSSHPGSLMTMTLHRSADCAAARSPPAPPRSPCDARAERSGGTSIAPTVTGSPARLRRPGKVDATDRRRAVRLMSAVSSDLDP